MANAPAQRLLTVDDLLALPDDGEHEYELVCGKLVPMPPPNWRSSVVAMNAAIEIGSFVKLHKLGFCFGADGGFVLEHDPDTVRIPDCAFVRAERIEREAPERGIWPGAPDLAVEVLSPSNRFTEMAEKVEDYLRSGVRLVWVIDPEARVAFIYAPNRPVMRVAESGVLSGEDVIPGFTLNLAEIWA
ncbi:MAG TPA: Uma2 family endonuclease [Dehalococcoidia bacterium]|nr:Uma2 family endonuclease [Dehalococcoidia bacterium]